MGSRANRDMTQVSSQQQICAKTEQNQMMMWKLVKDARNMSSDLGGECSTERDTAAAAQEDTFASC